MAHRSIILKSLLTVLFLVGLVRVCAADYVISGSSNGAGSFSVDDDLDVYLNGTLVHTDYTDYSGIRAPIDLTTAAMSKLGRAPKPGDVLLFQVRDTYGYCNGLSPLYLTCTPGGSSKLAAAGKTEMCGYPPGNNGIIYTTSFTIPPGLCPAVQGTIKDVVLNFPSRTYPALMPLAGATVKLLDSTGAEVEGTASDANGNYGLDSGPPPGTYTVEVSQNANLYSSSSNSYSQAPVKQDRTVTISASATVTLDVELPVSIVSEAATHEKALNNLPEFSGVGGVLPNPYHYNTSAVEAHVNDIISANPPPEYIGVFNGSFPRDDWNSIIRIDVAMETLAERASDAVLLANDTGKALGLWTTYLVFKKLGPGLFGPNGYFAPDLKPLVKSRLAAAANAFKIWGLLSASTTSFNPF